MAIRDEIARLLDPGSGLRCIPRFWKERILEWLRAESDTRLVSYRQDRLSIVEKYIAPLAQPPRQGGHPAFAALCDEYHDLPEGKFLRAFGLLDPAFALTGVGRIDALDWQMWALEHPLDRTRALYFIAGYFCGSWFGHKVDELPVEACSAEATARDIAAESLVHHGALTTAVDLLESFAGLADLRETTEGAIRQCLSRSPLLRIERGSSTQFLYMRNLARNWMADRRRGRRAAFHLLKVYLGWDQIKRIADWSMQKLFTIPPFSLVTPDNQAIMIWTIAQIAENDGGNGTQFATEIMEEFLGLRPDSYTTYAAASNALSSSRLKSWKVDNQAVYLTRLASALAARVSNDSFGPARGARLLLSFLGFEEGDTRVDRVRACLERSALQHVATNNKISFVGQLVHNLVLSYETLYKETRVGHLGDLHLAMTAVDAIFHIDDTHYTNHDGLRHLLEPLLHNVTLESLTSFLCDWARCRHYWAGAESGAARPLEMVLPPGERMSRFADSALLSQVAIPNVLSLVSTWLETVEGDHPDLYPTCEALVRYVCEVIDALANKDERQAFAINALHAWRAIRRALQSFLKATESTFDGHLWAHIETRFREWADLFENRLLNPGSRSSGGLRGHVNRLLDSDFGLWCLPTFWKQHCRRIVARLDDEELTIYYQERLRLVELYIEPLAQPLSQGGNQQFRDFCQTAIPQPIKRVLNLLGVPHGGAIEFTDWFMWAEREFAMDPVRSLYCAAAFCASSPPLSDDSMMSIKCETTICHLLGRGLCILGGAAAAARVMEERLAIPPDAMTSREQFLRVIEGTVLPRFDREDNTLVLLVWTLADAWRTIQARGPRASAWLLEWFGNLPNPLPVQESSLRAALDLSTFAKIAGDNNRAGMVAVLAADWRTLPDRGHLAASCLLEWATGIPETALRGSPEELRRTLAESQFAASDWTSVDSKAMIATDLSLSWNLLHERGPLLSMTLLEWLMGIPEPTGRTQEAVRRSLADSLLSSLQVYSNQVEWVASLAAAWCLVPSRGPERAAWLLEHVIGLDEETRSRGSPVFRCTRL